MAKCLDWASRNGMKTIAFPAFGTGVLQYPLETVASEMFTAVELFKQTHHRTSLKVIIFVIFPTKKDIVQVFLFLNLQTIHLTDKLQSVKCERDDIVRDKLIRIPP